MDEPEKRKERQGWTELPADDELDFDLASAEVVEFSPHSSKVREEGAAERFERLQTELTALHGAVAVVYAVLPGLPKLEVIESEIVGIEEALVKLDGAAVDDAARDRQLSQIDERLGRAEKAVMSESGRIPFSWMRRRLEILELEDTVLIGYLQLLLEHLSTAPDSYDRFELVMTQLLRARDESGIRPLQEAQSLFARVLLTVHCSTKKRQQAVDFFRAARERLSELATVDEVFASDFFMDVEGYKLALRSDYFDPEVLYASAELNIALGARLRTLLENTTLSEEELAQRFSDARVAVRKVFGEKLDDFELSARSATGARRSRGSPGERSRESPAFALPTRGYLRRHILRAVVVVGLGLGLVSIWRFWRMKQRDLIPVPQQELADFSPLLLSGAWGGATTARLFVGQIAPGPWLVMSQTERREALMALWRKLSARNCQAASFFREDVLVGHVVRGELLYVE